ncbi:MAG: HD-GYP domain-containing protein [Rhizobacter sp.]
MKNAGATAHIDVDALRVGMYIHLDVGWMSHPFPLSSFRIASDEQIEVIRGLGLKTLRWCPEQSALAEAEERAQGAQPATPAADPAPSPSPEAAVIESPEAVERRLRRAALAVQRAALVVCERQFAEATRDCRQLTELVESQPQAARDKAQALSQALVSKMAGSGELCIRLLTEAAGDKAAAHAVNVTLISLLMGRTFGFVEADMLDLGVGALLHDVGKLDLAPRLRHRDDQMPGTDATLYEEHVALGVAHARRMGLAPGATLVIAQHHEHADGSGFPRGLRGERMTPASCIVALVNRYDNLCNPHLAAKALTPHEALSLLFAQSRHQFEAAILSGFIKMMGVYPPGSLVQLTDDRHAMVVGVNSTRPLRPQVAVLDPRSGDDDAPALDLERMPGLGIRRSLRPQALPRSIREAIVPRARVAYFFEPAGADLERAA